MKTREAGVDAKTDEGSEEEGGSLIRGQGLELDPEAGAGTGSEGKVGDERGRSRSFSVKASSPCNVIPC